VRRAVFFLAVLLALKARADCLCPNPASASIVIAPTERRVGLVACGHEEGRRGGVIEVSELQVFRCDRTEPLLELDGTQTATVERVGDSLRVIEYSQYPFEQHWKWIKVAVAEWRIDSRYAKNSVPRPRLPKPRVSQAEVTKFLRDYRTRLVKSDRRCCDEESVSRMFVAAVSGNREALRLFQSMKSDARLDGAAAEEHESAKYHYSIGVRRK
jgi:hypothetical protein